jgi:glycerate dehydrogenase
MKIVVLDGYTLNPGDLSWDPLRSLGECTLHDRTPAEKVVERCAGAEIVLTNKTQLNREIIRKITQLRYIGVMATGYNVVNTEAARKRNVVVTNVPDYATPSVAQMVFAMLLEVAQRVDHHAFSVRKGRWCRNEDFCYWLHPLIELQGLTMGIVGFGRIGRRVAAIASAFGMRVLVHTRAHPDALPPGTELADLDALFRTADVVSLHCPLTPETEHMVNPVRLADMKPSAILVNTSRGGLVDEEALAAALNGGKLAGACLDVLSEEPPTEKNPLLRARNCVVTPHIAWATKAARERLMAALAENIRAFLSGHPVNVVS